MKILPIILFLISFQINSQSEFNIDCEEGIKEIDELIFEQTKVKYKVIQVEKLYSKGSVDFYNGLVILYDGIDHLSDNELKMVVNEIGNNYKVNELIAFKNCEVIRILYQAIKPTPEQEKFLNESLIGSFIIE